MKKILNLSVSKIIIIGFLCLAAFVYLISVLFISPLSISPAHSFIAVPDSDSAKLSEWGPWEPLGKPAESIKLFLPGRSDHTLKINREFTYFKKPSIMELNTNRVKFRIRTESGFRGYTWNGVYLIDWGE